MGKLVWQNSAAYFTAFCLLVHAALSQEADEAPPYLLCSSNSTLLIPEQLNPQEAAHIIKLIFLLLGYGCIMLASHFCVGVQNTHFATS